MQNKIITMPNPCTQHQAWNAMQPSIDGRFCQNCEKTVVDFTHFSDAQIIDYLSNFKSGDLCGRFKASQLNRTLEKPVVQLVRRDIGFWKKAAASLILGTWLALAAPSARAEFLLVIPPTSAMQTEFKQDSIKSGTVLKGIVLDKKTRKPLRWVGVELNSGNKNENLSFARTDENGVFELDIKGMEINTNKSYLKVFRHFKRPRKMQLKKIPIRHFKGTILLGTGGKKYKYSKKYVTGCPAF